MGSDDQQLCPDDMIFEILTRTSLKTLDTCKCVSKKWNNLIYESNFKAMYCNRTNNLAGYFIQSWTLRTHYISVFVEMQEKEENNNKIDKLPKHIEILASCNQGLLCCLNYIERRYYVCKPTTRQWQPLPNPKLRFPTVAVAIMVLGSTPLRYKIIRLSIEPDTANKGRNFEIRCEIFDSKCWSWRRLRNIYLHWSDMILRFNPAIRVGNSVHWLTKRLGHGEHNGLSFHEPDESFDTFSLPQAVDELSRRLVNYKGKLGVMTFFEDQDKVMELWVKCNDGWTLEMAVSLSSDSNLSWPRPIDFYDADTVFIKSDWEVVFYKLEDRSVIRKVELGIDMRDQNKYLEFRSDWEPIDLRGGR